MSLTTVSVTVRGITQDAVEVVADPQTVILVNGMNGFDKKHLEAIQTSIDGVSINNMTEALAAYTMPNGQTGTVYYDGYILNVTDVNAAFIPDFASYVSTTDGRLDTNEAQLADHEARITALEP